jgi:hypothetical protein
MRSAGDLVDLANRESPQGVLDDSVLEAVVGDNHQAAILVQQLGSLVEKLLQLLQLMIDFDAKGLEYACCRIDPSLSLTRLPPLCSHHQIFEL